MLPRLCNSCGHELPDTAKFCPDCGASASAPSLERNHPSARPDEPSAVSQPAGERRQLSVIFCDLVGSTALANRLDPEDVREIIGTYHACVAETVAAFGGHVGQYLGDGALIYFGYPQAHEADVERGASAALALVERIRELKVKHPLSARVGMATGVTVVGNAEPTEGVTDFSAVGSTPNLAARLQAVAEPGSVVISGTTRNLLGHLFEFESLGAVSLKGFGEPVEAWRLLGRSAIASRFEALRRTNLSTPLIGRAEEMEILLRRWQQVRSGEGRVVLLAGEAGIGKSRLTFELIERIGADDADVLRFFCSPAHRDSALYPFLAHVEQVAGLDRTDDAETAAEKLDTLVRKAGLSPLQGALIASLLPISGPVPAMVARLTAQRRKEETLKAVERLILPADPARPTLILLEDAHWLDPTSLDLLDELIQAAPQHALLVLMTYRPEFSAPWPGLSHVTSLVLNRLDERAGASLVNHIVSSRSLSPKVLSEIIRRTDGIPLFIEELTASVLEAADLGDVTGVATSPGDRKGGADVPATLQASLLARLDRLDAEARGIVQTGAAIGREFSFALLAAVSEMSESALTKSLGDLVRSGLIFEKGSPPFSSYTYKHALIQDAAYGLMLRGRRRDLHRRIAKALEESPDGAILRPELLAHHLTEAGLAGAAIERWFEAGMAHRATANREASVFFERASELLAGAGDEVPASRAIDIYIQLFLVLYPIGELSRAQSALDRAEDIATSAGDLGRLCFILAEKCYLLASIGELEPAIRVGERAVGLLDPEVEIGVQTEARMMLVRALYAAGHYREALPNIADAARLVSGIPASSETDQFDLRFGVMVETWRAHCLAELGNIDDAAEAARLAMRRASEGDATEHDRVWSSVGAGRAALLRGDEAKVIQLLEFVIEITKENWPVYYSRVAACLGSAYSSRGDAAKGLALLRDADRQAAEIGFTFGHGYIMALLAGAWLRAGDPLRAAETAAQGLTSARQRGERGSEAWLLSAQAEAISASGRTAEATDLYAAALSLAQELGMAPVVERCRAGLQAL